MRPLVVSFFVFLLLLFGSALAYQEWLNQQTIFEFSEVVSLSQSSQVQNLSAPSGKRLVPTGAILGIDDVTEVYYTYVVKVEDGHFLEVEIAHSLITLESEMYLLANQMLIFSSDIEMIDDTHAKVVVGISLNMPSSEEEANFLQAGVLSFQVLFHQKPNF
ncbi:MAG: hypothetical protein KJ971_04085 [Firmicutes bacterium]|nr:hypothetical protein [Bacillota bacterium]